MKCRRHVRAVPAGPEPPTPEPRRCQGCRIMSKLLRTLSQFYKFPFEKFLVNTTHEEYIELSIEDVVALASISEAKSASDLSWIFMNIVLLEEEEG